MVDVSNAPKTAAEYRSWWESNTEVPYGFCWCGCGEKTEIAPCSRKERGWIKGEAKRFIRGHANSPNAGQFTRKLTDAQEAEICRRYKEGYAVSEVVKDLGIKCA